MPTAVHTMSGSITHTPYIGRVGATSTGCKSTRSRLFDGKAASSATRARTVRPAIGGTAVTRDSRPGTLKVSMEKDDESMYH